MQRDTSRAALASVQPHISALAARVLEAVRFQPRTCYELCQDLDMKPQTVSARLNELCNKQYIRDYGERRPTDTGRLAIVWHPRDPS